ncbi:sensor histidine kinase [Halopenitus persicus]|uniref:sensor histidine kinase n=1 Tax=Halopenitus persicus TaxID=1048396 RepID=UPI000BBB3A2E|nr:ATP-binding protein [Halopenitus persicus]
MDRSETARLLSAILIAALGALLAGIFTYDLYQDVVLEGNAVWTALLENSVPYLLSAAIVGVGVWLGAVADGIDATTVLRWTVVSLVAVLALAAWVYLIQRRQGRIKPLIILAQLSAAALLGGIVIGLYSERRRRRRAQLAVEKSRLEALFENTSDAVARVAFDGTDPVIVDVNPAFTETFGYAAGETRGQSFDDLFSEAHLDDDLSEFRAHARRGERYETEIERERADGVTGVFVVRFVPLDAAATTADGFAVYTDITETRRYADRLDALHEATRDLIAASTRSAVAGRGVDAGATLLDLEISGIYFRAETPDGPVLEPVAVTEGAKRTFAAIPTLEPGSSLAWEVYESGSIARFDDVRTADRLHNPETPIRSELIVPLGDHGVFIAGSRSVGAFDEADVALARILCANVRSALDGARREQELRARERELAEQNARLEEFTSIVSHDLRNPLNVATGYLEIALEEASTSESADPSVLEQVDNALDRMNRLIEDLLTLARQGESIGETERVDLGAVAAAAWEHVDAPDAALSVEADATIEADRGRLQQLLENLFRNSVEHGGSDVRIVVGDLPDGVGFYVADDGHGIPESDRERVFESGYTTREGGTGFGLAIVSEIVDAHGWEIAATDGETGGARFEITDVSARETADAVETA